MPYLNRTTRHTRTWSYECVSSSEKPIKETMLLFCGPNPERRKRFSQINCLIRTTILSVRVTKTVSVAVAQSFSDHGAAQREKAQNDDHYNYPHLIGMGRSPEISVRIATDNVLLTRYDDTLFLRKT